MRPSWLAQRRGDPRQVGGREEVMGSPTRGM
jgi:hypothetical protein